MASLHSPQGRTYSLMKELGYLFAELNLSATSAEDRQRLFKALDRQQRGRISAPRDGPPCCNSNLDLRQVGRTSMPALSSSRRALQSPLQGCASEYIVM